jgi:hypothetical protein
MSTSEDGYAGSKNLPDQREGTLSNSALKKEHKKNLKLPDQRTCAATPPYIFSTIKPQAV